MLLRTWYVLPVPGTRYVRTRKYRFISVGDVVDTQNFNGQQEYFPVQYVYI